MKIEFRGNLSPKCKKEFKNACISSCVLYVIIILSLTTWGAVSSASLSEKVTSSIEFIKYMPYIMVPCGIIVCVTVIVNAKKGYKEPIYIGISQDKCISAEFSDGSYFWSYDDVQKVQDKGECYVVKVKAKRNVSILVCSKSLIVQGTKKDFEDLFSAKLQ